MSKLYGDEIFSNNLKRLLNEKDKKANELAEFLGVSKTIVSEWMNMKKQPRMDKIDRICVFLNCSRADLIEEYKGKFDESLQSTTGLIKLYDGIPAGAPAFLDDQVIDYIPTLLPNPNDYAGIKVHGDSMIGRSITDGCTVIIKKQDCADNGQIVACRVNNDEVTLKIFSQQGDTVILSPANPSYSPIIVPVSEFENGSAQILGIAIKIETDIK
ncbi:MAG: helix-turn-helix domain-containing protein [Clostridia bacterium]|nr:helix-turn-helix domain-containing protein [Clostridia bacterium]